MITRNLKKKTEQLKIVIVKHINMNNIHNHQKQIKKISITHLLVVLTKKFLRKYKLKLFKSLQLIIECQNLK